MAKIVKVLGTMGMGGPLNEFQSHKILKQWSELGQKEIDTAIMYQNGKTEEIIGKLSLCRNPKKIKIACKANPKKGFKCEDIIKQLDDSLGALRVPTCDIFYLHWPDHETPIEDTLKGVNQLYQDGKFKEFGLSNYSSWQVADIYHICKENNYPLPTVYQGMYNALTRDIEQELIPALRRFGIRFYVYNPLAGGMLSGKYNFNEEDTDQPNGRFFATGKADLSNQWVKAYRDRYWRDQYKDGIQVIQKVLSETYNNDVSLLQAAMRWMVHHSQLKDNDGVILGFSKEEHLIPNVDALDDGPLHEDVVKVFDEAWQNIKSGCPSYYR